MKIKKYSKGIILFTVGCAVEKLNFILIKLEFLVESKEMSLYLFEIDFIFCDMVFIN